MRYELEPALWWALWCAAHSLLIVEGWTSWLQSRLGGLYRFYRLFYNTFSILTLVWVLEAGRAARLGAQWDWPGAWQGLRLLLLTVGVALFYAGARRYDWRQFLGWRQIRGEGGGAGIKADGGIDRAGVLGLTRHPWYLAGMLVVWARPLYGSDVAVNAVLCGYFVVGAWLEERKLLRRFGDEYRQYRREVSMLFPFKWLLGSGRLP